MPQLKFYNVKTRKSFTTDKYKFKTKMTKSGKKYFAVANKNGTECWRIVSKDFYDKYK